MTPCWTYKNSDVPDIDAVAPWDLQTDLRGSIYVRLHIFIVLDIPGYSRAEIAKNRLSDAFREFKGPRSIDSIPIDFFPRRGVVLFGIDECCDG